MNKRELQEALLQLKAELARTKDLHPDKASELDRMAASAEARLLEQEVEKSSEEFLWDRFREYAIHLEEEHPKLTGLLGRISNSLSNLGI